VVSERGGLEVKICIIFLHAEVAKIAVGLPPACCFSFSAIFLAGGQVDGCIVPFCPIWHFFSQLQVYNFHLISVPCIISDI